VAAGGPGSLVELDARFARSRRRSALRRARLRRPTLRKRLRRPLLAAALVGAAALAVVGGSGGFAGVRATTPARVPAGGPLCPVPAEMRQSFVSAARVTGVPIALLAAVAIVESRMDQRARSDAGALGVLQVMPATAAELGLDPNRVDTNILAGARYLERMLERYGSTDLALAAYNAGPTALDRAGGVAPTSETQTYVANVQARWQALSGCR
jgi:soluble lytic murein transglycosylase-like protein